MQLIINSPKTPIAFNVFNYQIHWYGIVLVMAIIAGLLFTYFLIKKNKDKTIAEDFLDFSPFLILASLVGARIFYVIGSFDFYKNNPKEIFLINHGGISIWGAIIFGIIVFYLYLKKKKYDILEYFDFIALAMPLSQAIGRWGNFFNQEAYGSPTNGFLKLYIDKNFRYSEFLDVSFYHPTFLYESILNIVLFSILVFVFFKFKNLKKGTIFYLYLIFYGIIRVFVEHYRIDSVLYIDNFPIAQVISFFVIVFATIGLFNINKKTTTK